MAYACPVFLWEAISSPGVRAHGCSCSLKAAGSMKRKHQLTQSLSAAVTRLLMLLWSKRSKRKSSVSVSRTREGSCLLTQLPASRISSASQGINLSNRNKVVVFPLVLYDSTVFNKSHPIPYIFSPQGYESPSKGTLPLLAAIKASFSL